MIKSPHIADVVFYSSKCNLRPYFTAHSSNPPPKIKTHVLKHPFNLHMPVQVQWAHSYCHDNRAPLLLELGCVQKEDDHVCMLLNHILLSYNMRHGAVFPVKSTANLGIFKF